MLIAFSLRRSWAVLSAPDEIGSSDIRCMHGLRAVCSLALYMAHKVIPAASAPYSNRGKLTQVWTTQAGRRELKEPHRE